MPQTSLGNAMRYVGAVLVMSSGFALLACSGGTGEKRNVNMAIPLNSITVVAVEGAQPLQFTIPNGSVFDQPGRPGIGHNPVSMLFNPTASSTNTLFILARFGSAELAGGGVTFGPSNGAALVSCTLTVTSSSFLAGPQTGDTLTFPTCGLMVSASNVEVGGDPVDGTLALVLTNDAGVSVSSTVLTVTSSVSIQDDGILLVNNVVTGIPVPKTT